MKTFAALSALLALAVAVPDDPYRPTPYHPAPAPYHPASPHHSASSNHEEPAQYQYGYAVQDDYSGVNFQAHEARDGDATNGEYRVALPDGRTQIVTYNVADAYSGFVADVRYEGYAEEYQPAPYKTSTNKPASYEPAPYESTLYKPTSYESAPYKHVSYKPTPYKPAPYDPTPYKPVPYKPVSYKTASYKTASYKPASYEPASYEPASYKPAYQPTPFHPLPYNG